MTKLVTKNFFELWMMGFPYFLASVAHIAAVGMLGTTFFSVVIELAGFSLNNMHAWLLFVFSNIIFAPVSIASAKNGGCKYWIEDDEQK